MPFVESAGAKIYWEPRGQGAPLLLIMGLGATLERWHRIEPFLSARFRTIVFDNRGAGRTSVPPGPYSIEGMADDAAAVLDAAEVASAHVFGVSMGGMIAQELVLRHPSRVRSLILGCTTCGGREGMRAEREILDALNPDPSLTREQAFWATASHVYDASTPKAALEEDWRVRAAATLTGEGYVGQLAAVRAWKGTHDRLASIKVPTLVIHGENDRLIPAANGTMLAEQIAGAKLVMLKDASHIFLTDKLELSRDAVLGFLERV